MVFIIPFNSCSIRPTQVQAFNSLPGRMSKEITVHHKPNIEVSEGKTFTPRDKKRSLLTISLGICHVVNKLRPSSAKYVIAFLANF